MAAICKYLFENKCKQHSFWIFQLLHRFYAGKYLNQCYKSSKLTFYKQNMNICNILDYFTQLLPLNNKYSKIVKKKHN